MASEGYSTMKWINILTFVLTVIVNGLAGSTTILGGKFTAEISDANPTLITPAGYVFSIWGIIYILLGVFVVFQALPSQQGQAFQKKNRLALCLKQLSKHSLAFPMAVRLSCLLRCSNVLASSNFTFDLPAPRHRKIKGYNA